MTTDQRSNAARYLAIAATLAIGWYAAPIVQHAVVAIMTGEAAHSSSSGANELTLGRYIAIGIARTIWWLAVALLVAKLAGRRPVELCWRGLPSLAQLTLGVAVGIIGIAIVIGLIVASGGGHLGLPASSVRFWGPTSFSWLGAETLIAAAEELLFRATLFVLVRRLAGRWTAYVVSSVLFALAHGSIALDPLFAMQVVTAGLVLAYSLERSGTVWWPIGIHTGWNWGCATLFGAANSGTLTSGQIMTFIAGGPRWVDGGTIGPEASVFAYAGWCAQFLLVLLATRRSRSTKSIALK